MVRFGYSSRISRTWTNRQKISNCAYMMFRHGVDEIGSQVANRTLNLVLFISYLLSAMSLYFLKAPILEQCLVVLSSRENLDLVLRKRIPGILGDSSSQLTYLLTSILMNDG